MSLSVVFVLLGVLLTSVASCSGSRSPTAADGSILAPHDLQVDHQLYSDSRRAPSLVVVEAVAPLFSWRLRGEGELAFQHSYRIQLWQNSISTTKPNASTFPVNKKESPSASAGQGTTTQYLCWDSGVVFSSQSLNVPYGLQTTAAANQSFLACPLLLPRKSYTWKVTVWPKKNETSSLPSEGASATAFFLTGLQCDRSSSDCWSGARWIRRPGRIPTAPCELYSDDPVPLLRKSFFLFTNSSTNVSSSSSRNCISAPTPTLSIHRATMYVAGLGFHRVYVNGEIVNGGHYFDPAWTSFNKTVLYTVHDVTSFLSSSPNDEATIGVMLGKGWWDPLPMKFWGSLNLRDYLVHGVPMAKVRLEIIYQRNQSSTSPGSSESLSTSKNILSENISYFAQDMISYR